MKNLALARKWRPKNFETIVGQEFIVEALKNSILGDRLHHAYLLSGTRGVGKTTIARIFAKCLNCHNGSNPKPCCECSSCLEIDQSKSIDVIELDAASNTQVDNMRELLENANYQPTSSKYKIFIIDEVHMLSKSSFNAMLKTLEEPPEHVIFILATTDPEKIPVTVISRCLHFNLMQMTNDEISGQLKNIFHKENIAYEDEAINMISKHADGSMRDALSLADRVINYTNGNVSLEKLTQILGVTSDNVIDELLTNILDNNKQKIFDLLNKLKEHHVSYESALKVLSEKIFAISEEQTFGGGNKSIKHSEQISLQLLQTLYQISINGLKDLPFAPSQHIGFRMTIIRLLNFIPTNNGNAIRLETEQINESESIENHEPKKKNSAKNIQIDNWDHVVDQIKPGMAKTLAQNCVVKSQEDNFLYLIVDERFKHLNNDKYIKILEESLYTIHGVKIKIEINEETVASTPAQKKQIEKDDALKVATDSIKTDSKIENILNEFDAQIIESTIKSTKIN
jgi:DNA polymerase III subunit gamma/tau